MGRIHDPAKRTRERLLALERQAKARAEARAVAEGVAETVALSQARGQRFEVKRGARAQPYRRLTGLAFLTRKGRITPAQLAAGEAYGLAYRRARPTPSIGSTLEVQPGGQPAGPSLKQVLAHGAGTAQAQARLAAMRRRLMDQADLTGACDLICGEEKTPREASGGCDREAARLEAVLKVALDLLALRQG